MKKSFGIIFRCGVVLLAITAGTPCVHAETPAATCSGWRIIRLTGDVQRLFDGRRGVPVKMSDCLEFGMSVQTGDTATLDIKHGADTLSVSPASIAVLDTHPMIFRQAWMKTSWASSKKIAQQPRKVSIQNPVTVAGVRGAERGNSPQPSDFQWLDNSADEMPGSDELAQTYQKMETILAKTTDTEARGRLHLYLADMAVLLLRPEEARFHLEKIPMASKSYSEARKREMR